MTKIMVWVYISTHFYVGNLASKEDCINIGRAHYTNVAAIERQCVNVAVLVKDSK